MRKLFGPVLALALLATGYVIASRAAQLPLPAVNGPYLGDQLANLYTLTSAYIGLQGLGTHTALSADQTSGQTNCTQLGLTNAMDQVTTSSSTGYLCLPVAVSGKIKIIANQTTQTIDLYSSNTPYVAGTADTINGTAGSTPYSGLTTNKVAICFAVANGAWACGSIS